MFGNPCEGQDAWLYVGISPQRGYLPLLGSLDVDEVFGMPEAAGEIDKAVGTEGDALAKKKLPLVGMTGSKASPAVDHAMPGKVGERGGFEHIPHLPAAVEIAGQVGHTTVGIDFAGRNLSHYVADGVAEFIGCHKSER